MLMFFTLTIFVNLLSLSKIISFMGSFIVLVLWIMGSVYDYVVVIFSYNILFMVDFYVIVEVNVWFWFIIRVGWFIVFVYIVFWDGVFWIIGVWRDISRCVGLLIYRMLMIVWGIFYIC